MNYNNGRWKRKREAVLKHYEYLCQESKRYGKNVQAVTVHHIYPVEFYPELAWESWNMIPLSLEKHNAMHVRDTHEITELGKRWQEKVRDKFEQFYGISPHQK